MQELFDLEGRVVIVTGGTRGIGRALVGGLSAAGASVVLTGRDARSCEAVAGEVGCTTGRPVVGVRAEMSAPADLATIVDTAVDRFGRIDVLINNAGVCDIVDVDDVDADALQSTFTVNVLAPLLLSQAAVPHMRAAGSGSIVNVLSSLAFVGRAQNSVYAASKAALLSFTRSCAAKWAMQGVRVNALVPGATDTEMTGGLTPEQQAHVASAALLNRIGKPEELIGAAVFLASGASSYVTGQALSVDGGMVMH